MSTKNDVNNQWPHLPPNIQGINYDLINKISNDIFVIDEILLYIDNAKNFIKKYAKENSNKIKTNQLNQTNNTDQNDSDISDNFDREAPPLNFPCVYSLKDGCVKKAAFKHKIDGVYCCWFHKNLYKPSN